MEFVFSDEQEELRAMVRDFLGDHSPETEVRRLMETAEGFDRSVWAAMAELGLTGLAIPEQYGGAGCGPIEVGIVMEEAGAALLCAPYLSTVVLAVEALLAAGDEAAAKAYLPGIADGSTLATLAFAGPRTWSRTGETALTAAETPAGWRLSGTAAHVTDGVGADLVLALAAAPGGVSLFAVESDAGGLERAGQATMDATRRQARLTFADTPARLVGPAGGAGALAGRVLDAAAIQLAAEQLGGARRVLEMAVDYAKLRVQFGRPIGAFQAIKHKCADMVGRVEAARSAAYHALWAADALRTGGGQDVPVAAAVARVYCSEAYYHCAEENILVHGGVGYTWEHPAHLYFKRAAADRVMFGDPNSHREILARHLGM